jgi:toxin YoeB
MRPITAIAARSITCKLLDDLAGACSRRINIQNRLVYQVLERDRVVKALRMRTHYE